MKKLLLSVAFASAIIGANESPEKNTHLAPRLIIPETEISLLIGFNIGLATGAACAFIDHYTNDRMWVLTWLSMPTLRKLIMSNCYESYKSPSLSLKEKNKIKKRKNISSIVGEVTAWMIYYMLRNGMESPYSTKTYTY
jgi:hypothetical protein